MSRSLSGVKSGTPLRVVIVSRIFSPEPSAASFMLESIARAFRDTGADVLVLTTTPPAGLPVSEIRGVSVRRAPVLRDRRGYVRGYVPYLSFDVPLFFRLMFRRRADLYLVEPPPTTGAVVRVATWLLRRPYVYDAADLWSDAAQMVTSSRPVLALLRGLERFALRGARMAFAISEHLISRMRELNIRTPAIAIGFGVDAEAFRFRPRSKPEQRPFFVYAGTYSEWHGAGIFLEAFAEFLREHPDYRLIFVGNGSDRDRLEARRDELGIDCVEFRDPIDSQSLDRLFADATASLASVKPGEGYDYAFATKVYSSIAAGCPVVFSGVGPTVQFLESESDAHRIGRAVPYDTAAVVSALAMEASRLATPGEREELSGWARQNYSLSAIAETVVKASIELLGKRSR
jgi:glycosyltransferase involved in cell wall biosynthesis